MHGFVNDIFQGFHSLTGMDPESNSNRHGQAPTSMQRPVCKKGQLLIFKKQV